MARYRKIDTRIWNDQKFRAFPDAGKLAFIFVLTHPAMTALGAMRGTIPGLAAELGWPVDAMRDAMKDAIRHGMVVANEDASYIGVPKFLKYNEPEGPNSVIKAWPAALELIPECPEKRQLASDCRRYLLDKGEKFFGKTDTHAMWDAINDAISEPSPIPEPEQEPDVPPTAGASAPPGLGNQDKAVPKQASEPDPIFGNCLSFLINKGCTEKSARSFIGLMRKNHGTAAVIQAIERAERDDITDPIPWLRKALESRPTNSRRQPQLDNFDAVDYGTGGPL